MGYKRLFSTQKVPISQKGISKEIKNKNNERAGITEN
jgi:hypothetical protein